MYKKILTLLTLIVMIGCSSNPVSVEKVSTFTLQDFDSFVVVISDKSDDVKVSPFTNAGFKKEFSEQLQNLGLTENLDNPDFKAVISLSVDKKNKRRTARRSPYYYYDPFYDDYGYQTDRFNKIIKTEIEKNQKIINLDFKKISFLLDIKKINLLVKFIDPKIEYKIE